MKSFDELTPRGKARRLRKVALAALEAYDLDVVLVELLGLFTNALFRVRALSPSGKRVSYVLRVCAPGWRTETDLRSEVAWLRALAADPDIGVPVPLSARDGRAFVTASAPGIAVTLRCMVMSWIPGVPLGRRLTEENLEKMGALFARMHAHGAAFDPPEDFTSRQMRAYLSRDEPDVLFEESRRPAFSDRAWDVATRVRERVAEAFATLYASPRGLRVIHNDLWHDNIKIYRGRLHPLDFEDTIWGYPVQDIAMAFQDLWTDVSPEDYTRYVFAVRRGYEALAPWPERYEGQIDDFRAGRMLWVANYVALRERPHLEGYLERTTPAFERYLTTGRLA